MGDLSSELSREVLLVLLRDSRERNQSGRLRTRVVGHIPFCRHTDAVYRIDRVFFEHFKTPPLKKVRSSEWGSSISKGVSHEKNGSSNSGNVAAARRFVNHVFGRRRSSATKLLPGQLSREIGVARLLGD